MAVEPTRWGVIYNPKAGSRKAQERTIRLCAVGGIWVGGAFGAHLG